MTPPFESYTLDIESLSRIASTYNAYLLRVAAVHQLASCDVAATMSSSTDWFYDDCHFNEAGARIFAASVAGCLIGTEIKGAM